MARNVHLANYWESYRKQLQKYIYNCLKYGIQFAVYIDKRNATQRNETGGIMAIKLKIIANLLQAYRETGNVKFLARANKLQQTIKEN